MSSLSGATNIMSNTSPIPIGRKRKEAESVNAEDETDSKNGESEIKSKEVGDTKSEDEIMNDTKENKEINNGMGLDETIVNKKRQNKKQKEIEEKSPAILLLRCFERRLINKIVKKDNPMQYHSFTKTLNLSNINGIRFESFRFVIRGRIKRRNVNTNANSNSNPSMTSMVGTEGGTREIKETKQQEEGKTAAEAAATTIIQIYRFKVAATQTVCFGDRCVHLPVGGAEDKTGGDDNIDDDDEEDEPHAHRKKKMHNPLVIESNFHRTLSEAFEECLHIMRYAFRCISCDAVTSIHETANSSSYLNCIFRSLEEQEQEQEEENFIPASTSQPTSTPQPASEIIILPSSSSPSFVSTNPVISASLSILNTTPNSNSHISQDKNKAAYPRRKYLAPRISPLTQRIISARHCARCCFVDHLQEDQLRYNSDHISSSLNAIFTCMICMQPHKFANRQEMFCQARARHQDGICVFCFGKMRVRECPVCREISSDLSTNHSMDVSSTFPQYFSTPVEAVESNVSTEPTTSTAPTTFSQ